MPRRGDSPGGGRPAHGDPRSRNPHSTDADSNASEEPFDCYADLMRTSGSDFSDRSDGSRYLPHMEGRRDGARGGLHHRDSRGAHHFNPRDGRAGGHRDPHGMVDHGRREVEPRGPRGRARETDPRDSSEGQRARRQYDSESEDTLEDSASDSSRSDVYIDPEEARRRAAYVEHNRTHGFSCYEDLREGSRRRQYEADRRALEEEMAMYDDDRFVPPRGRSLRRREEGPSRMW